MSVVADVAINVWAAIVILALSTFGFVALLVRPRHLIAFIRELRRPKGK